MICLVWCYGSGSKNKWKITRFNLALLQKGWYIETCKEQKEQEKENYRE